MFKKTRVSTAAALLASGLLAPAMAQTSGTVEKVETVVVTGSRIVRPNLTSATPVLSVSSETMGNLGIENFADMATQLPQFTPAFGSSRTQSTFSGVASSGLNQVNLRNLGTVRSLVLINGRRVPGGTSTSTDVDFNTIPTANIERVEVITGGASAIYGADAVGGVVNIITKKNFQGLDLNVSYGVSEKGDNKNPSASVLMGGKFGDAGHAMLTLQFDKQGRVSCADREFCEDDFTWNSPGSKIKGPNARSSVGVGGQYFINTYAPNGDVATSRGYVTRNGSATDANGNLIPFVRAIDGYNRNGARDIAIPTDRMLVAGEMEYKLSNRVKAYAEFNYAQAKINAKFEGQPFQSTSDTYGDLELSIPTNNPFIPAAMKAALDPRQTEMTWFQRFTDTSLGARGAKSERATARTVLGLSGEFDTLAGFGSDWRWDVYHVYGSTKVDLGTQGSVGRAELYNSLRVEQTAPGVYRCADPVARALGCVPVDPFKPYTQAMRDYLVKSTNSSGQSTLNDTVASLSGSLFALPAGDLRASVGLEQRSFAGNLDHDSLINGGLVTGNQLGDTSRIKTTTKEVFAEVVIPVLADKPFIESLNLEGAVRRSEANSKSYNTWKVGGDWAPITGLRFRAMKARSVREPVPGELSGGGQTFGVIVDPCTRDNRGANATRTANCAADGVPADYNPEQSITQSVSGFSGANPNLKPEEGNTLTYGFVWQPASVKGLSLSVDRFEIEIDDVITSVERQTAVNLCYDTASRLLCSARTRGTHPLLPGANYVLTSVDEAQQNVATLTTKGVDIDLRYGFKTDRFGEFDLGLTTTIYDKASWVPIAGQPSQNLLGFAGGSTSLQGYIKHTASANIGWKMGAFRANWNVRYIGSADMGSDTASRGFPKIGAHDYHNVRGSYAFSKKFDVYAGVTNLFDKKPPLFASGSSGTQALDTVPGYYDVFGRSFFVGMNAKF